MGSRRRTIHKSRQNGSSFSTQVGDSKQGRGGAHLQFIVTKRFCCLLFLVVGSGSLVLDRWFWIVGSGSLVFVFGLVLVFGFVFGFFGLVVGETLARC